MINLPSLESAKLRGRKVFVRCDFDVPLSEQPARLASESVAGRSTINKQQLTIADETRLVSSIGTIEYLLENGAIVIAAGHLGRPEKQLTIDSSQLTNTESELSLRPIAEWFVEEFPGTSMKPTHIGGFSAWKLKENFYILENLRFYKEEEGNDSTFSHKLAYLADSYVNEAFGASHRPHASIVGVPALLPHFAGFHLSKEVKILTSVIENPRRPFTFIVGGAKIETKLPLISKMHKFADYVLVGGELAEQGKILIEEQHKSKSLPAGRQAVLLVAELNEERSDITQMSLENFLQIIPRSNCIIWNGPLGVITPPTQNSKLKTQNLVAGDEGYTSLQLAEAIIASSAYRVIGGGDTVAFLNKHGLLSKFDFASTGGGAMLEFLSGQTLPGIIALQS